MRRLAMVAALTVPAVTYARVRRAEQEQRHHETGIAVEHADAIVVFGGGCTSRGPTIEVRDRLNHAIGLWEAGVAPLILVSGGRDGDVDEVEVMQRYLTQHGVPGSATGQARPGDNTRLTLSCLDPSQTYVAVSSAYHAHRIAAEARRQGKRIIVDCAPDSIELRNSRVLRTRRWSEVLGCILYASPEALATPARRVLGRARHTIPDLFTPH